MWRWFSGAVCVVGLSGFGVSVDENVWAEV